MRIQLRGKYPTGFASIQCIFAREFNSHLENKNLEVKPRSPRSAVSDVKFPDSVSLFARTMITIHSITAQTPGPPPVPDR